MFSSLENVNNVQNWEDLVEGYANPFLEADENSTHDFSAAPVADPMNNTIQAKDTKPQFNSAELGVYGGSEFIAGDHLGVVYNQNSTKYSVLPEMGRDEDLTYTSGWEDWRPPEDSQSQIDRAQDSVGYGSNVFEQMQGTTGLCHATGAYTTELQLLSFDPEPIKHCDKYDGSRTSWASQWPLVIDPKLVQMDFELVGANAKQHLAPSPNEDIQDGTLDAHIQPSPDQRLSAAYNSPVPTDSRPASVNSIKSSPASLSGNSRSSV